MTADNFTFRPTLLPEAIEDRLARLLVPGKISDAILDSRLIRLEHTFNRYAAGITHGLWAPGLVITHEMRAVSELFLPLRELHGVFNRFLALAMTREAFLGGSVLHQATSWLDVLHGLQQVTKGANPAELLRSLLADERKRRVFLFANFLPTHYGGSFGRYPQQGAFLADWLRKNRERLCRGVSCLDVACGCGEGTYELAASLVRAGFTMERVKVCGASIEPFEVFAAAHGFFPHDLQRQERYRQWLAPLQGTGIFERMTFRLEDLMQAPITPQFDVILCNGILGGPFVHEKRDLGRAIRALTARLRQGGVLLAADRFHGGWKNKVPQSVLVQCLIDNGVQVLNVPEGVAALKLD